MKVEQVVLLRNRWTRALTMLLFLAMAIAFIPCHVTAHSQQLTPQKFTLSQIEGLVAQKVPDATLANQIRLHGLAFAPTPAIIDELRAKGAGLLTISAIEAAKAGAPVGHAEHNNSSQQSGEPAPQRRDWTLNSPIPLQPGRSLKDLRTDEIWEGGQYGLGKETDFGGTAAAFSSANSSRLGYGPYISGEGTFEMWIKVNRGYRYDNYQFRDNLDEAIIFSSDCAGGDVTWPGATKLTVRANGDITLYMATSNYDKPPAQPTVARGTPFRFGEWHAIGISYGSQGQWIMLDGKIVAASPLLTQTLGKAGNHQQPLDETDIGETPCTFWAHHQYEGGFDGVVAGVRLSKVQKDWALALGINALQETERFTPRPAEPGARGRNHPVIQTGEVDVQTEPGSAVSLDGHPAGNAGTGGFLALPAVPAGDHDLTATADGFAQGSIHFSLAANEDKRVSLPLEWAGGFLSLTVKPDGAAITVTGPKSFGGIASDVRCPPGNYTATASLDGYIPQTRNFQIAAGEHHAETFELALDPAVLTRKLDDAKSRLAAGDPAGAEQLAGAVLAQTPDNPDAAAIVAESAFQQGDMNRFVDAGAKAIRGGKQVTVRTMHAHTVLALWIHPVDVTISESGISVVSNPPDSRCKIPPSVGFDLIESVQVVRDPQRGFIELHIQYASKPHGAILHDLDFVPEGSQAVAIRQPGQVFGSGASNIQEPGNAGQTLDGILRLIIRAKR